jgi:hypothetical protein
LNGKKNEEFISPNFTTQITIGDTRNFHKDLKITNDLANENKDVKTAINNPILGIYYKKNIAKNAFISNTVKKNRSTIESEDLVCNNCYNGSVFDLDPCKTTNRNMYTESDELVGIRSKQVEIF